MRRPTFRSALLAALLAALPAEGSANARRAERALGGPRPSWIDLGPADLRIGQGIVVIHVLPAHEVRAACPAALDWHSRACTLMPGRVILMPDEESSGLTTGQWLDLLRHELLHASGHDFHGRRP